MSAATLRVDPIQSSEQDAWEQLATKSVVAHRHQCFWWMAPLERYGFQVSAIGCWRGDQLVGGALFRSYPVPLTRTTVTECLDGPLFLEWDSAWADDIVLAIQQLAKSVRSMAVIIRDCPRADVHRDLCGAFRRINCRMILTPGSADAVLPLAGRSLDEIRKGFNHGTRGRVRKALSGSLQVRQLTTPEDLKAAYSAWMATATRKSFTDVRPWRGLEPVLRHCIINRLGFLLGTFLGDRLLAASFVVHVGTTAVYVYGGYVDGAEKYSPTHVLQFEGIRECLERGLEAYNFGMLISEVAPEGRGVDEFKLGFGAVPQRHLDTILWKRRPLLYDVVERLRNARGGSRLEGYVKQLLVRRGDRG
jgi:hypothetical protein